MLDVTCDITSDLSFSRVQSIKSDIVWSTKFTGTADIHFWHGFQEELSRKYFLPLFKNLYLFLLIDSIKR